MGIIKDRWGSAKQYFDQFAEAIETQNAALEKRIKTLEDANAALKAQVTTLEKKTAALK